MIFDSNPVQCVSHIQNLCIDVIASFFLPLNVLCRAKSMTKLQKKDAESTASIAQFTEKLRASEAKRDALDKLCRKLQTERVADKKLIADLSPAGSSVTAEDTTEKGTGQDSEDVPSTNDSSVADLDVE